MLLCCETLKAECCTNPGRAAGGLNLAGSSGAGSNLLHTQLFAPQINLISILDADKWYIHIFTLLIFTSYYNVKV